MGLVGEDRALIVLWAPLWDQPPEAQWATYSWLPPNTSSLKASPGHSITKVNKCNAFLLFTNDTFPSPAGRGGEVGGLK